MRVSLNTVFTFSREDLAYCIEIGCRRWNTNRNGRVRDQMYSKTRSSIDCSVVGVIGEYALLKMFGLPTTPLEDTSFCSHSQDRGDAHFQGKKIDVKCPVGLYCQNIQVMANKIRNPPDAYAFMVIDRPAEPRHPDGRGFKPDCVTIKEDEDIAVHFRGFATKEMLVRPENLRSLYYGRFYRLHQSELLPWESLRFSQDDFPSSTACRRPSVDPAAARETKRTRGLLYDTMDDDSDSENELDEAAIRAALGRF